LRNPEESQNSLISGATSKLDCETGDNVGPDHLCGSVCTSAADHDGMAIMRVIAMPNFGPISTHKHELYSANFSGDSSDSQ